MAKIIDITLTIGENLPIWEGDPPFILERVEKMEEGNIANVSRLDMGVHTGTHIDAPYHFIPDGKTIEHIPLEKLVGPVQVVRVPDSYDLIDSDTLKVLKIEKNISRLLFKTRNSYLWQKGEKGFRKDFVALADGAAADLVGMGIELVGIDYLSIAAFEQIEATHQVLLKAGLVALEGLDLSQVEEGIYTLFCLPLKLEGCDGAPARAVLMEA